MLTNTIIIDGTATQLVMQRDINKDGIISNIEQVTPQFDHQIIQPKQQTELGEAIEMGFKDKIERDIGTSTIDLLGNLEIDEANLIFVIHSLVTSNFLPKQALTMTRHFLRLSVSRKAKGRSDWKDVSIGKRTFDQQNFQKGLFNFVGRKPKDDENA